MAPLPTMCYYGWTLRFRSQDLKNQYPGRYYQMVPCSYEPVANRMEGHVCVLFPIRADAERAAAENPDTFFKTPVRIRVTFEPASRRKQARRK